MNNKEKQIEEMAKVIESVKLYGNDNYERKISQDSVLELAEELATLGYRKIPEDSEVMTREELIEKYCQEHEWVSKETAEKYQARIDELEEEIDMLIKEQKEDRSYEIEQARKETAEKFARLVEFHSVATIKDGREHFTISALGLKEILHEEFGIPYNEIAKQYGVDRGVEV